MLKKSVLLLLLVNPLFANETLQKLRDYSQRNGASILREYAEFLSIPNVATDKANIMRNATYIRDALATRGAKMELLRLDDLNPIVYGTLPAPNATRTLMLYMHYDGQPVDTKHWTNPPWRATLYSAAIEEGGKPLPLPGDGQVLNPEWRLYGRGASDDKSPLPCLLAALDALAEAGIQRTSNLIFFFEGEEEIGSPNLKRYASEFRDKLNGDLWLFLDGPMHQSSRAQLVFGVRGFTGLDVTVYGASRSLHSGHYGNWAPDPSMMLARLIASMKDERDRVTIKGFYDSVEPLGQMEREALAKLPVYDQEMRQDLSLHRSEANNAPYVERLLIPSLTVKGLQGAGVGTQARNVISSSATSSLGIRLVKGNDPEAMLQLVEDHIEMQGYYIVRQEPDKATRLKHDKVARITRRVGYPAARTSMNSPLIQSLVNAATKAAGAEPYLVPGLGGSLPLYIFTDFLAQPAVIVPIANHDNNQHAPDENLRMANLLFGIDLYGSILTMD